MISFVYSYAVGGLIFLAGLVIAYRAGYINRSAKGMRNLGVCLLVAGFFMSLQAILQFAPMGSLPAQTYVPSAENALESRAATRGQPLDYIIMIGYFIAILAVGTWYSRKQSSTSDFFFGGPTIFRLAHCIQLDCNHSRFIQLC